MKFYPNNCQKCYEVVKLYDVRLLLLLEWELGTWVHAKRVDGEEGVVLSQHGRETQDGEVQKWYMSWKVKWNKSSYSMREIWDKEIDVQWAKGRVKVEVTSI